MLHYKKKQLNYIYFLWKVMHNITFELLFVTSAGLSFNLLFNTKVIFQATVKALLHSEINKLQAKGSASVSAPNSQFSSTWGQNRSQWINGKK